LLEELLSRSALRQWFRRIGVTSLTRVPAAVIGVIAGATAGAAAVKQQADMMSLARTLALAHCHDQLTGLIATSTSASDDNAKNRIGSENGSGDWVICGAGDLSQRKWERLRSAVPTVSFFILLTYLLTYFDGHNNDNYHYHYTSLFYFYFLFLAAKRLCILSTRRQGYKGVKR